MSSKCILSYCDAFTDMLRHELMQQLVEYSSINSTRWRQRLLHLFKPVRQVIDSFSRDAVTLQTARCQYVWAMFGSMSNETVTTLNYHVIIM